VLEKTLARNIGLLTNYIYSVKCQYLLVSIMEKPEYRVEDVPKNTQRKYDQLNNMFKDGYEFVAVAMRARTKASMIVTHNGAEHIVKRGDINIETISSVDLLRQKASVAEDNFRFTRDLFDFVYNNKII